MDNGNLESGVNSKLGGLEPPKGVMMNGEAAKKSGQDAIGHVQAAVGSAKDAVGAGAQAANVEIDALKDQISKLAQTVTQLVQSQASTARDQVMSAVGSASDTLSQHASAAQGTLTTVENDIESRIKRNPWSAIAIAGLLGLIIAKTMS